MELRQQSRPQAGHLYNNRLVSEVLMRSLQPLLQALVCIVISHGTALEPLRRWYAQNKDRLYWDEEQDEVRLAPE